MLSKFNTLRQQMDEVFSVDVPSIHEKLVHMAKKWNGKVYLVGGAVRDELMNQEPKDLDYVVTGTDYDTLEDALLRTLPGSTATQAGKSFGIVILHMGDDQFEFALPRVDLDRQTVTTDPNLSIEEDLKRRDLTINALAKDLETGEIVSVPGYDGVEDIKNKILRSVGNPEERFDEDPLRMLRVLQFAARFGFTIEAHTLNAIKTQVDDLKNVSGERFKSEFEKAWTKGNQDTEYFFHLLDETGIGRVMFGEDFDPIPVQVKTTSEPFKVQNVAAFLNGGDYTVMNKTTDDQRDIEAARIFKDLIDNGVSKEQLKNLSRMIDRVYIVGLTFKLIDSQLYSKFEDLTSKPLVPLIVSEHEYKTWMLPVRTGELIQAASEAGHVLHKKAIGEAVAQLIEDYQLGHVLLGNDMEESREIALKYFKNSVLHESCIRNALDIEIIRERMRNILK
jgi:tRNA nucleotidyltransferase/poly(A) polymerase